MIARVSDHDWGFPNPATPPGSTDYYCLRFAPASQRDALATLLGWRHLVRAVLTQVSDLGVGARKLAWWQEELDRIIAGTGQHPIAPRLHALIERHRLTRRDLGAIIWGTEAILVDRPVADGAELRELAALDLGALCALLARVQDGASEWIEDAARQAGTHCARIELIRDAGRLLRAGRAGFLPDDALARHELTRETIALPDGRHHLAPLLADLAGDLGRERLALERLIPGLPVDIRIRVRLADRLLAEIADSAFAVADQRIALTPLRKLWHAWRESRRPE